MLKNQNEKNIIVRTRFAPSPTGELHVGGARTALFNYLWTKRMGGQFILRIEDTDYQRNQQEFISRQYEDLVWLGCEPNESPFHPGKYEHYRQSQRLPIYQKYLQQLLAEKKAYYCFCSPAELAQEKTEFREKNQRSNYQYSRKCLRLTAKEINSLLHQQQSHVIRFQVSQEKNYQLVDLVRGRIIFPGRDLEDFVLCRSNGVPLLNFAVVIDDHLMEVSHVLRGEEHLSNTAKQLVLYEALGWTPPQFGHLSLILNQERQKLSKRDQGTSQFQLIRQLRELGYLPEAVSNYLLFLGWHPRTTQEIFSLTEASKEFNLKGLHARGAVYTEEKLNWYNNYYIQRLAEKEFADYSWSLLQKNYQLLPDQKEWAIQIASLFRPQLSYWQELVSLSKYFFRPPALENNSDFAELTQIKPLFAGINAWTEESVRQTLHQNEKKLFPLLRKKLTGENKGPELSKIIYLLGKKEMLNRI